MISKRYRDYLKSPQWQKKRRLVFAHYGKRCYACRSAAGPIQVHHLSYDHIGKEQMADLMPLCTKCHKKVTAFHRRNRRNGLRANTYRAIAIIKREIKSTRR